MDASETLQLADFRAMAEKLRAEPAEVRRFVATALGHIERLTASVQELRGRIDASSDAEDARRQRLDDLVIEQAALLKLQQDTLDRVRALCDLAEWSESAIGGLRADATILVGDLARALNEPAIPPRSQ